MLWSRFYISFDVTWRTECLSREENLNILKLYLCLRFKPETHSKVSLLVRAPFHARTLQQRDQCLPGVVNKRVHEGSTAAALAAGSQILKN